MLFFSKAYFLYFLEAKNSCIVAKYFSKSSYICVFILPKKQQNFHKSGITSISQEWLVVESCPTPRSIAFLMFHLLVCNIDSHFNELIMPSRNTRYVFITRRTYFLKALSVFAFMCKINAENTMRYGGKQICYQQNF